MFQTGHGAECFDMAVLVFESWTIMDDAPNWEQVDLGQGYYHAIIFARVPSTVCC